VTARHGILLATLILVMPGPLLRAQVVVMDEGTFSLLQRGTRIGREDFSIRRTTGGGYVAQGNFLRADSRATMVLNTDSLGSPERFQLQTSRTGRVEEEVSGERRGTLWSALALRQSGERGVEFRLPPGSFVAEGTTVHHLWFLLRFAGSGVTSRLQTRAFRVDSVLVEAAGNDRVTIGLDELEARKFVIRSVDGRGAVREIWTDADGRLLRVRIAAEEFEAIRDELPPETPRGPAAYDESDPSPSLP
jgi:hypothetical protein